MKKLKSTIPDGGAPLGAFPVLRELFDEQTKNAIEALLYSVSDGETEGFVLKGCEVTGIVSDYDIAEGYIYVDGEVLYYAGSEGNSTPVYLKKDTVTEESGVFADGASKAYIDVNTATEYTTTGGGAGTQYITFDFDTPGRTFKNMVGVGNAGNTGSFTSLKTKVVEIGDWNMDATSEVSINHGITNGSSVIRFIYAVIQQDSLGDAFPLDMKSPVNTNGDKQGGVYSISDTSVTLERLDSGFFDDTGFDSTGGFNRGWITILYED